MIFLWLLAGVLVVCYAYTKLFSVQSGDLNLPPLVALSDQEIFHDTRLAYEGALKKHGSIIRVPRKGRMEYIVDSTLAPEVLTNDVDFSFEKGTLSALNLGFLLYIPRSFIRGLDALVHEVIIGDIDSCIARISPVFENRIRKFQAETLAASKPTPIDITEMVHQIMSEAMLTLILGKEYASEENIESVNHIAIEVATLAGIFENLSPWARSFPTVWRVWNWIKVMLFSIPYYFVFGIGSRAFRQLADLSNESAKAPERSVLFSYAQQYMDPETKKLSVLDRVWILALLLGLIFASVHQTVVVMIWVILELAKRPEQIPGLREESIPEADSDGSLHLTYASLRNAERLDSFIREVMRTKGDTLSTVRKTTRELTLGGYSIPPDSAIIPLATLSHMNEEFHGPDAHEFVADRWVGRGKPAVMVNPSYWPFGLGRWACPGRVLAVSEIKLAVMLLITHFTPTLVENNYKVVDPLNVTSVAPQGMVLFTPFVTESR